MSVEGDARTIYNYLRGLLASENERPKTTYGQVERATGVPAGEHGGYMGKVLGHISWGCAQRQLPPLTSIVVRPGRDEIPGPGYFDELANLSRAGNPGGWHIDQGITRWGTGRRPPDLDKVTERWMYREMVEEHQEHVWAQREWPDSL